MHVRLSMRRTNIERKAHKDKLNVKYETTNGIAHWDCPLTGKGF